MLSTHTPFTPFIQIWGRESMQVHAIKFPASLMSISKRRKSNSKQYNRGDNPLLASSRYGCIIGVKNGSISCHHPGCPSMLRGKNIENLTYVDCTGYNHVDWMSLVNAAYSCCSSLWIGTTACRASSEEQRMFTMMIMPGELARVAGFCRRV